MEKIDSISDMSVALKFCKARHLPPVIYQLGTNAFPLLSPLLADRNVGWKRMHRGVMFKCGGCRGNLPKML